MSSELGSIEFQGKLLALFIKDAEFLKAHASSIQPLWFESPVLRKLCNAVLEYHKKYSKAPGFAEIAQFVHETVAKGETEREGFSKLLKDIRKLAVKDLGYVRDNFENFAKRQIYKALVWNVRDAIEEGRLDAVPGLLEGVRRNTAQQADMLRAPLDVYRVLSEGKIREVIPTGMATLDASMGGGTARKELTTVMGFTNIGKSLFMVHLSCNALRRGYRVLHLFTEQTKEKVLMRYVSNICNVPKRAALAHPELYTKKFWKALGLDDKERLIIADSSGWTVDRIKDFLYSAYSDAPPDILVVDYPDCMLAKRQYNEHHYTVATIYSDLVELARRMNLDVRVVSQSRRESEFMERVGLSQAADSIEKMRKSDNVLVLQQTEDEKNKKVCRVSYAKSREEEGNVQMKCSIFGAVSFFRDEGAVQSSTKPVVKTKKRVSRELREFSGG